MTHLGRWVSALADGQLPPAERDLALAHVAACPECAERLRAERAARRALAGACDVTPSPDLTARLLSLPGGAATAEAPRARRHRVVLAAGGALAAAAVAVGGLVVVGSVQGPRADPSAMLRTVSSGDGTAPAPLRSAVPAPSDADVLAWMRAEGWVAPDRWPAGLHVVAVEVHDDDGVEVLEVELAGADSSVRLVEQRGHLAAATAAVQTVGLHEAQVVGTGTEHVAVESNGTVVMVAPGADDGAVGELLLRALPVAEDGGSLADRLGRGWAAVTGWLRR